MRVNRIPRKRITVALGGVLTLTAGAWIGAGVSYASTGPGADHHPGPGPSSVCNVPSRYPTIQAAVDAPACKTVNVAPGSYPENVTIGRSLTLNGARSGQDARGRRSGGDSVVSGGAGPVFTINADNVTIDGFTVNGPSDRGTAAFVMQTQKSGETVQNNVINNPGRAASITTNRTTFRGNLVKNTATAQDGFQTNSFPVHDFTVSGNAFSGGDPATLKADVTVIEGSANVTVADNRSTGDGTLIALFKTAGAKITGNTVVGATDSSAIYIGGADSKVTVSGNTVSAAGSAVKVANAFGDGPNSTVTITRNTIRNNQNGVSVAAGSTTDTVQATRNSISGNSLYGVYNDPTSGGQTNATCNWWGNLTGPGPVGPGRGDKISTNVTYQPWLKLSSLILGCN